MKTQPEHMDSKNHSNTVDFDRSLDQEGPKRGWQRPLKGQRTAQSASAKKEANNSFRGSASMHNHAGRRASPFEKSPKPAQQSRKKEKLSKYLNSRGRSAKRGNP